MYAQNRRCRSRRPRLPCRRRIRQSSFARHVRKSTVAIVVVKISRVVAPVFGNALAGRASPHHLLKECRRTIVVVVNKYAARAMVSGSHFLPTAPLLWVKRMPASGDVAERNLSGGGDCLGPVERPQSTTETRRHEKSFYEQVVLVSWVPGGELGILASSHLDARTDAAAIFVAGLRPAWTGVPPFGPKIGSGTDTCSWMFWRSLLSPG